MPTINLTGNTGGGPFDRASKLATKYNSDPQFRASVDAMNAHRQTWKDRFENDAARLYAQQHQAQSRQSAPLRPSTYASAQREMDRLDMRAAQFQRKWGVSPFNTGELGRMRTSLGTEQGAHRTAEIMRTGSLGQRYAFEGNYRGVAHLERELRRIEGILERSYRFESSPAQQANLARQRDALLHARSRIEAGFQGTHPLVRSVGMAWGRAGNLLNDPIARTVKDAAMLTAGLPYAANLGYAGVVAMGSPWIDYRRTLAQQSRAGGFSANRAQALELRRGAGSYVPGRALTNEAAAFGLAPQDIGRLYSAYGVSAHSARGRLDTAEAIRMGYLMPGNGIGEDQIARMLGGAVSMGAVGNNQQGWNAYFRQLQRIEGEAMRRGIDQSTLAKGWQSFMTSAASGGVGFDFNGLSSFFRRLTGVSPSGRSGALQQSILAGVQGASDNLGSGGAGTLAFGMALGRLPANALATAAGVQKFLGMSNSQFASVTGTPAGKRALAQLMDAAKAHNGYAEMQYLGVLTRNSPDIFQRVVDQLHLPSYMRDQVLARVTNTPLANVEGWQSAPPSVGYHGAGGAFVPAVYQANIAAARKYGVPADAMLANTMMESSGGQALGGAATGAWGAGQIRRPALLAYNAANGTSYTLSDMMDPAKGADVEAWYLKHQFDATGDWGKARLAYHFGLGGLQRDGVDAHRGELNEFDYLRRNYSDENSAMPEMQAQAGGKGASLKASEYAFKGLNDISSGVTAVFRGIADSGAAVAKVFDDIAKSGSAVLHQNYPGGHIVGNQWVPNAAIPNDHSRRVVK